MLNGRKEIRLKLLATLLLLVVLSIPGSKLTPFNDIPLAPFEIISGFTVLLLVWTTDWATFKLFRTIFLSSLILLIIMQFIGAHFIPYGWNLCLERGISEEKVLTPCEPSAEFPHGELTYTIRDINYSQANFPLYFMNDSAGLNYYRSDQPNRRALPYKFEATGYVYPSKTSRLTITTNIPEVTVSVNNGTKTVIHTNVSQTISLIPRQPNKMVIAYATHRQDSQYIRVEPKGGLVFQNSNIHHAYPPLIWLYQALFWGLLVTVMLVFVPPVLSLWYRLDRPDKIAVSLGVIGLGLFLLLGVPPFNVVPIAWLYPLFYVALIVASWYVVSRPKAANQSLMPFFLLILFYMTAAFVSHFARPQEVVLFTGGDDELGHETFARLVMVATTWRQWLGGAETGLFYYQPLYRYFGGEGHRIMGEAMWGLFVFDSYLLGLVIYLTLNFLIALKNRVGAILFTVYGFLLFQSGSTSLFHVTMSGYQQAIGTPLFLLAIVLMLSNSYFETPRWSKNFWLGLLLGVSFMIRTDLLPAAIGAVFYLGWVWIKTRSISPYEAIKTTASFVVGLSIVPLFVLFRNYSVAGQIFLMPTSTLVNLNPVFYKLLPYGPSKITGGSAILTIIKGYQHNLGDLAYILLTNIKVEFIGPLLIRQILWYATPIIAIIGFILSPRLRFLFVTLFFCLAALVFFSSFFHMHNGVAMLGHMDYLLILLFSSSLGAAIQHTQLLLKRPKRVIHQSRQAALRSA